MAGRGGERINFREYFFILVINDNIANFSATVLLL